MSPDVVRVLWWLFGLFNVHFSTLAFLRARGMDIEPDSFGLLAGTPDVVPTMALPVMLVLFALVLWLTGTWSEHVGQTAWASRVPLVYFQNRDINFNTRDGKLFQSALIALFLIAPYVLIVLMGVQYLEGGIFFGEKRGPDIDLAISGWEHFNTAKIWAAAQGKEGFFRGGYGGHQFYPLLTWVYAGMTIALGMWLSILLRGIFRRSNTSREATGVA